MYERKTKTPAYLTVYLALIMCIMLSLCLTLIEGVRSNAIRMEAECVVDIAMNSVFAEYHRELFRRYNLFAIDASYGTIYSSKNNTEWHLQKYIERNLSTEDIFLSDFFYKDFLAMRPAEENGTKVTEVSILTDGNGAVFRQCAMAAVKDDVGITLLEDLSEWIDTVSSRDLLEQDVAAQKQEADEELDSYDDKKIQISEQEWITINVTNPTEKLNHLRSKGILEIVIPNPLELSQKGIVLEYLVSERMKQGNLSSGNILPKELSEEEQLVERFFFQEYLLRYMGRYGQERENAVLDYQMEYLVAGKNNDLENLKSVANILCALREAANASFLFSNQEKSLEAETLATAVSSVLGVPEITQVLKNVLLLGWSYAESLYDVEVLLSGGKVPLIKTNATWHYDLDEALSGESIPGTQEAQETQLGLSYEDYLRIFMMFTDLNTLTERAMNMVEADIRLTQGNSAFRLDSCYDGIEAQIKIESAYGYQYDIRRGKYYSLY